MTTEILAKQCFARYRNNPGATIIKLLANDYYIGY